MHYDKFEMAVMQGAEKRVTENIGYGPKVRWMDGQS